MTDEPPIAAGGPGRRAPRRFLGWSVVAGGGVLQLLQAMLLAQSFGLYVVALTAAFGWSKTVLSTGYALIQLQGGLLGPVQGWLLDRFGPRAVVVVGVLLKAVGLVWLGLVEDLVGFYGAMVLLGIGSAFAGFLSITTAIVRWFVRIRARALALNAVGMSIGGLLVPLVAGAVVAVGWRETLLASGVLMALIGVPAALLVRDDPKRYGQRPDGGATTLPAPVRGGVELAPGARDFTLREAMRTRAFWMLSVGHGSALLVVSAVLVHLIPHLNEGRGYTLESAAAVLALVTAVTIVGQLLGGVLGDRLDKRAVAIGAMIAHALALVSLAWGPGVAFVFAFALLHGLAWGVRGPLMGALRADYFGSSHYGSIMGVSILVVMLGQLAGPIVAGTLADTLGDYRVGFSVLAGLAALGSLAFVAATPPTRRRDGDGVHGVADEDRGRR